tara:strand:- start:644 stop:925 length:282 start_codon:yes stop_codon:yes gene_type:complete
MKYLKENFSFIIRTFKKDKSLNQRQKNRANITVFFCLLIIVLVVDFSIFIPNPCDCLDAQKESNDEIIKKCEQKFIDFNYQERADWINDLDRC